MATTELDQASADRERQELTKEHIRKLIERLRDRNRSYALCSMVALFGVAYVTLDRVPQSVLRVLRTQAEVTMLSDEITHALAG